MNKYLGYLAAVFVLYLIVQSPDEAADLGGGFSDAAIRLFSGIGVFLEGLLAGAGGAT